MSGQGLYLSKDGETLYFGRGGANSAHNPEFFSLDVSNPASINQIDSKYLGSTANAMTVRQNLAFMVTSDPSLGFQIWDLDNLSNPSPYGSINVEQTSTGGMDCEGNYMYVAQKSNKALQIVGPYIPSTYALSNSGNITVTQGQSGGNTITATIISGTPPSVSFSISGLPAGAVPTFNPTNCTPNCSTTLSISTNYPATPAGTYPILVTGTGGITTTFNLIVNPLPIPFDYSLSVMPATIAMNRGSLASTIITVTKISGIAQPVTITVSGMQNNVTITPNPVSCTPNNSCNITLNITAAGNAQRVTRTITVTGNLPTRTTTFTLTIN
jgi:hypothetical protein